MMKRIALTIVLAVSMGWISACATPQQTQQACTVGGGVAGAAGGAMVAGGLSEHAATQIGGGLLGGLGGAAAGHSICKPQQQYQGY